MKPNSERKEKTAVVIGTNLAREPIVLPRFIPSVTNHRSRNECLAAPQRTYSGPSRMTARLRTTKQISESCLSSRRRVRVCTSAWTRRHLLDGERTRQALIKSSATTLILHGSRVSRQLSNVVCHRDTWERRHWHWPHLKKPTLYNQTDLVGSRRFSQKSRWRSWPRHG
ncbi:hypothetical protein LX32DRAFT_386839 [Colletotrichum zoysiae]|uniref:Uncharacterized protein n=1 Tax=Colletotrichum zoysiae TaxID=1216348 RepID=A0AAD9HH39_9PEZI|nr:hypothetical protein LX32DRAFT_386839 [Colletotrichum zoysiae]